MRGKQRKTPREDQDDQDAPKAGAQALPQRRGMMFPLPKGIKMRQRQERKLSLRQAKAQKGGMVFPPQRGIKDRREERKLYLRLVKTGRRGVMFPLPKGVKS